MYHYLLYFIISFAFKMNYASGGAMMHYSYRKPLQTIPSLPVAILFDCDGVIVETEELHRVAYNQAFEKYSLKIAGEKVHWSEMYYEVLQNKIGGGKPKMKYYFNTEKEMWPEVSLNGKLYVPQTIEEQDEIVDRLQDAKTQFFLQNIQQAKARPGVLELMDEIFEFRKSQTSANLKIGICSASSREGFNTLVNIVVGKNRLDQMDIIIAGDDVSQRKPHPMIYNLASDRIGINDRSKCLVIEDSLIGLQAAKDAQMKCIITYTASTKSQNFYELGADAVLPSLDQISLHDILSTLDDLLHHKKEKI